MKTTFIYGLVDPRDNQIRYVGKSDDPQRRLSLHMCSDSNPYKREWLNELAAENLNTALSILAEVDQDGWGDHEQRWIQKMKDEGHRLLNIQPGGIFYNGARSTVTQPVSNNKKGARVNRQRIKELRSNKGYTQEEFARQTGLTMRSVSNLEARENTNPTLETLSKLAVALGVRVIELITE